MNTYGFHSIHGRAAAIATGVKLANPELSVWVATGDGDLLSIGGNHFIHTCRKNIDLKILLFNNRIYGLTKGQYSPTSEKGKITKSTPYGSIDFPFNPVTLALGAEASFVARSLDRDPKHLQSVIKRAAEHKGTAFIEIYQNCNIFNNGAYERFTEKETKDDNVLVLEHGKPMVFGKNKDKGIIIDGTTPKVVSITEGKYSINDLLVHNEFDKSVVLAYLLGQMSNHSEFPTPIGVFRQIVKHTYNEDLENQIKTVTEKKGAGDFEKFLFSGNTWEVQ
jgi:2-oxoglutarate ferredoxin oxidoreductase subunit beta